MRSTKKTRPATEIRSTAELAKHLGLSRWTVSRVLNGHDGVHPATVTRIHEAIRQLGFSPNPLAQGLKTGRTNIVGVCLPEIEGFYLGQKLEFLRQALAVEGYHVMVGITNGDSQEEAETLGRFRLLRAVGVILFASQLAPTSEPIRQFHQTDIPLLLVDPMTAPKKGILGINRALGMKEAMRHLFELGHRHIATLGLTAASRYSQSRLKGVASAYEERGWNPDKFVRHLELPSPDGSFYEQGHNSAAIIWNQSDRPTAILALNDRVAIGLMDGLRKLGVRVPEDISVIGYDNMEVGAFVLPQLTTIDAQPDELVRRATERLLGQIRGDKLPATSQSTVSTRLIIRASTGAAHSRK